MEKLQGDQIGQW